MVGQTSFRYYTKYNISKKFDGFMKCMSEKELFPTDHLEYISIKAMFASPCEVLTFKEYEDLSQIEGHVYFTR